jgi:Putative transposase
MRGSPKAAFKAYLAPLREIDWVVYAKEPFAGPSQVLRYLSRYTHRIAISNRQLVSADENGVTFKYKDYRIEGPARYKTMTLATDEFIRRFLIHVLTKGYADEGLPSHPTLWAARQRQPIRKHCARARAARRAGTPKRN